MRDRLVVRGSRGLVEEERRRYTRLIEGGRVVPWWWVLPLLYTIKSWTSLKGNAIAEQHHAVLGVIRGESLKKARITAMRVARRPH